MARSDDAAQPADRTGVFAADEVLGPDLAAVDWASTPLGPPASWPQSLRTAVGILLSSRFPMWLAWGPDLTFFCNNAYRRDTLGRKYPWALGRPAAQVWAEIWDDVGPRIETVLTTGRSTWDEGLLLFLERSGYPEETYHTFSYSPLRDDADAVVGMLCVVSEDTDRIIGERRLATLRELGSDRGGVRTEQETLAFAGEQLGRNPHDLPFTLTYLFGDDGFAYLAGSTGIDPGEPASPTVLAVDGRQTGWPAAALARGEATLVALDATSFTELPTGAWTEPPAQALVVPIRLPGGTPYGFLVAGLDRYRRLDHGYRGFVELVAGHLASGIAAARSYRNQQRRAEELAELDRAKTTFFANISHEFRTPLTLIMGPVAELRGQLADSAAPIREDLDVIHRNGLRLGKLVNTLLDFSRIEAGRMQAAYEPTDLSAVTAELASVFRSAIDQAGLQFEVDCPPMPEPVYLDRGMWEKVILNLLSNALKFTFDGSIGVRVRAEGNQAVVVVTDTGIGVRAAEMPRLFERFHRIENTRSRSNEGSGIGLALVRELVGLHGGTISADSTVGRGTRFTIRLPFGSTHLPAGALSDATGSLAASAAVEPYVHEALRWLPGEDSPLVLPAGANAAGVVAPGPAGRARVLVADDNVDMRGYLARLLSAAGYDVSTVADGARALDAIRSQAPDLLVCDVMMPRLDGLSLVAALRADDGTAALPVVLLSARAGEDASIEGLRVGADDYLVKPFAAAELLARVRANIELSRLRGHHSRWRNALVGSLQEAFFVCAENGAIVEVNAAFTDILGYGPEGVPYLPPHPWWPDVTTDPVARQQTATAFAGLLAGGKTAFVAPAVHSDGSRRWISAMANTVPDPDTGGLVVMGTFRDVTAEHYAVQRENALAALNLRLSGAASLPEALSGALAELRRLWHARRVLAALFSGAATPELTSTDPELSWAELTDEDQKAISAVCEQPTLSPATDGATSIAVAMEHPAGTMVLWLDLDTRRPLTDQDELLLSLLAGRLAQGLSRAYQIDQDRETALALQRAILGPAVPGGFAVGYEPAARPLQVGGDWYDTVVLRDGRIGIIVGDCVGRGLEAAAVMGQLRSACRALLLQQGSPARTLTALDDFAADVPGALCTTVFCGVLDQETGTLTYSSAGHPPAILTNADGTGHLLDQANFVPLAVRPGTDRPEARRTLPPHATLLVYTDGLVERRRRSLTDGIEAAAEAVRANRNIPLGELVTEVMDRLAPAAGYEDDVALLLYRHPAPLDRTFPAQSVQLASIRAALRQWLHKGELPTQAIQGVLVAVGEACANAIEHGSGQTPGGTVRVRAEALVDDLHLIVSDTGSWKAPQPDGDSSRGRGLALIRALTQRVSIAAGPDGTVVDMHVRIS